VIRTDSMRPGWYREEQPPASPSWRRSGRGDVSPVTRVTKQRVGLEEHAHIQDAGKGENGAAEEGAARPKRRS